MQNPVSWNTTPKEGGLLAKVVTKHENNIQVDPLASIPIWGKHSQRTRRSSWDPVYATFIIVSNLMITLLILPSLCGKGHSLLLVHSVLS